MGRAGEATARSSSSTACRVRSSSSRSSTSPGPSRSPRTCANSGAIATRTAALDPRRSLISRACASKAVGDSASNSRASRRRAAYRPVEKSRATWSALPATNHPPRRVTSGRSVLTRADLPMPGPPQTMNDRAVRRSVRGLVRRSADCVHRFRQDRDLGRAADQPCGSGQAAREVPLSQREGRCRFGRDAGEVVGEATGGLVAAVGFLLEEPADHCAERGWHRRRELRERGRLARKNVSHQFERVDLGERRPSGRNFVQHGAKRVEVGSTVNGRPGTPGLLR